MNKKASLLIKLLLSILCINNSQIFTLPTFSSIATTSYNGYQLITDSISPWSLAAQCVYINALKCIADYKENQILHRGIQREKIKKVYCPNYLEETVKKMGFRLSDITFYKYNSHIIPLFAKCDEFAIFANDDLMMQLNEREQQAFIGHELAHIKNNDQLKRDLLLNISTIVIPITLHLFDKCLQTVSNKIKKTSSNYFSYIIDKVQRSSTFITHSQLIAIGLQICLFFKYSQYQEYQADITAAKKLGVAQPMANAFARICEQQKQSLKGNRMSIPNKISFFFTKSLHPTFEKRIAYLRAL